MCTQTCYQWEERQDSWGPKVGMLSVYRSYVILFDRTHHTCGMNVRPIEDHISHSLRTFRVYYTVFELFMKGPALIKCRHKDRVASCEDAASVEKSTAKTSL